MENPMEVADDAAMSPDALAHAVAAAIRKRDRVSRQLGIDLLDIGPGRARMALTVREDMLGGHDLCHGGILFTLADTVCAYACCSRNVASLSQTMNTAFVTPARLGDRLEAEAVELVSGGRTAYYDVRITNQTGQTVAVVRGQCRLLGQPVIAPQANAAGAACDVGLR
ncbi:MAG TPA: hydroxyphenylacetyl-CoA thioesterase PaaI [Azospirillum sp.]